MHKATKSYGYFPHLFFGRGEHGHYGEANRLHGEGRAPVFAEDGQADVAVAVDVRVDRDVLPDKDHLRGVKRVLGAELERQRENFPLVEGVGRALHLDSPAGKSEQGSGS